MKDDDQHIEQSKKSLHATFPGSLLREIWTQMKKVQFSSKHREEYYSE